MFGSRVVYEIMTLGVKTFIVSVLVAVRVVLDFFGSDWRF